MEHNVEEKPTDPAQSIPNHVVRRHVRPAVRAGLVLGLASAGILMAQAVMTINMKLITLVLGGEYGILLAEVINTLIFVGVGLGLAGNITIGTTLKRRAAVGVILTLVGTYITYDIFFFNHPYDLAPLIAIGIVAAFPRVCVCIILWHKGRVPKVMTLAAVAYGAYVFFMNCVTYLTRFTLELDLGYGVYGLIIWAGELASCVFYFLWCGLWIDLNARPGRYLAEHLFREVVLTVRSQDLKI